MAELSAALLREPVFVHADSLPHTASFVHRRAPANVRLKPLKPERAARPATVLASILVVALLLILPLMAVHHLHWDLRWVGAYVLVVNLLTYWTYARDKRSAQAGEWRVSEGQLHLWELLGGWPGAWIAQRCLRHKCSKGSYQFVFWLIVLSYQFAAADSLQQWKFSRAGMSWIEQTSRRSR
jgi:uncharacterized membrane protein YsdA (DUF1294 family)